jgi:hypothetical protein
MMHATATTRDTDFDLRDQMVAFLRAKLRLDPSNLNARLQLGQILLDGGDFVAAREVLEPAGVDEFAVEQFIDIASSIGVARALTGDRAGAGACFGPLLHLFSAELDGAQHVDLLELAAVLRQAGYATAARNLLVLSEKTLQAA